jgi:uridylate kinase
VFLTWKPNLIFKTEGKQHMRIVFRIGGSVVASPINTELISMYIEILKDIKSSGHEVIVVVGGGSLAREFINIAKSLKLEMSAQDEVAISVSRLFAQLFLKKFGSDGCSKIATTLEEAAECISEGKILVMGGLRPGITTDTVGALVAEKIGADLLVKGSDQDGVFTKDPRKHPDAVKLDRLSYDELQAVFSETEHKAGIHQIIDPEAVKVLKRKRVRLIVVNGYKPQNVLAAVNGEKIGTLIQ